MKKTNIPTDLGIKSHRDLTGLADTITGYYRLDGSSDEWIEFEGPFTEDAQPGTYLVRHTFTEPGIYALKFESTNPAIGTHYGKVEVGNASLDDIKDAITTAQNDITTIKEHVESMDSEILDTLNEKANEIEATLSAINDTINDEEASNGIVSLRELLVELKTAGNDRDSLINTLGNVLKSNTDDLEAMIRGDEFLSDGTTPNPFHGKSGYETYDLIVNEVQNIKDLINSTKEYIENTINTAKISIEDKINGVQTIVDRNAIILNHTEYGNAALKAAIDNLSMVSNGDTQNILNILEDANNGLVAIKNAIIDKLNAMDGKLDILVNRSDITVIA